MSKPLQSLTTIDLLYKSFLLSSNQSTSQAANPKCENTSASQKKMDISPLRKKI